MRGLTPRSPSPPPITTPSPGPRIVPPSSWGRGPAAPASRGCPARREPAAPPAPLPPPGPPACPSPPAHPCHSRRADRGASVTAVADRLGEPALRVLLVHPSPLMYSEIYLRLEP